MVNYIDKTDIKLKSLEISFLAKEFTDNSNEIPETTDVTIQLSERKNKNIFWKTPYQKSWTNIYSNILVPTGVWHGMKLGQLTNTQVFAALGTDIVELDIKDGKTIWIKHYGDSPISFIKLASNNQALYVLYTDYKFYSDKVKSNIIKIDLNGKLIWSAETKYTDDVFTGFNYGHGGLSAFTWDSWIYKLNEETGKIIDARLTK